MTSATVSGSVTWAEKYIIGQGVAIEHLQRISEGVGQPGELAAIWQGLDGQFAVQAGFARGVEKFLERVLQPQVTAR